MGAMDRPTSVPTTGSVPPSSVPALGLPALGLPPSSVPALGRSASGHRQNDPSSEPLNRKLPHGCESREGDTTQNHRSRQRETRHCDVRSEGRSSSCEGGSSSGGGSSR